MYKYNIILFILMVYMNNMTKLKNELRNLPSDYIVLLETSAEKVFDINIALIKLLFI